MPIGIEQCTAKDTDAVLGPEGQNGEAIELPVVAEVKENEKDVALACSIIDPCRPIRSECSRQTTYVRLAALPYVFS